MELCYNTEGYNPEKKKSDILKNQANNRMKSIKRQELKRLAGTIRRSFE